MVSQKGSTISFKNKTKIRYPEEEHIAVLNTHEPLVSQEEFDLAQKIFRTKRRSNRYGIENVFVGVLKCSDCGSGLAMQFPHPKANNQIFSYACNRYRQHSKYCTTHYIRCDDIHRIVLDSIQEKQRFVKAHEDELALYAQKLADDGANGESKQLHIELERLRKRCTELDTVISKLFEQAALGVISQERFLLLSATYEDEHKSLKEKIAGLEARVSSKSGDAQNILRFFELVARHSDITELSVPVIHQLIDSIVVYQAEGGRKDRTQRVVINFRFIRDNWFI
jgi:hypothetical protein